MKPHVNKLILGTVQFGLDYGISNASGKPSEDEVHRILEKAYACGVRSLDTADHYGDSQRRIAGYLGGHEKFAIFSKFILNPESQSPLGCLDHTLSELGLPDIAGYSFHRITDFNLISSSALLKELKATGKVKKIGISVYSADEVYEVAEHPDIDIIQIPFNLLDNYRLRGASISYAKNRGKLVHVRSVFLQGLFFKPPEDLPVGLQGAAESLSKLRSIANDHGISINALALLYPFQFPEIDGVIIGVNSCEELESNIQQLANDFPEEAMSVISELRVSNLDLLNPSKWNLQ